MAGKTAKFSDNYGENAVMFRDPTFLISVPISPKTGIREISVTHYSPSYFSLYSLSLLKVSLTSQKIDNTMGLKDFTLGHFTFLSKAKPKTMPQFPNRPPPSDTLKLYIYSTGLQYSMVYFFLLCLLQSRKGQKFEDQYNNDISDKIWLVLPFPSSFLS